MDFDDIVLYYIVGGIIIVLIGAWLSTRKGNTISDVIRASNLSSSEKEQVLSIEVLDKVKVSSGTPAVAFFVIGAIVMFVLPLIHMLYLQKPITEITLVGDLANKDPNEPVYIVPQWINVTPTGRFYMNIPYANRFATINFENYKRLPTTIDITVDVSKNQVEIASNRQHNPVIIKIDTTGHKVELKNPIKLIDTLKPDVVVSNIASAAPETDIEMDAVPPPSR